MFIHSYLCKACSREIDLYKKVIKKRQELFLALSNYQNKLEEEINDE